MVRHVSLRPGHRFYGNQTLAEVYVVHTVPISTASVVAGLGVVVALVTALKPVVDLVVVSQ